MKMKKLMALVLALTLVLALAACGQTSNPAEGGDTAAPAEGEQTLIVYTARSESLNNAVIENFEADGPTENGWHFCPGCGREIIVEAVNPCPFDNENCMCQFCETPCNNGLNCSDCAHEGKAAHDVLLCTGFDGSMEQYTENWKRKQMEKLGGGQE